MPNNSPGEAATALKSALKPTLVWIAAFSFLINILMLTGPLFMMQVFDRVLGSGSVETLVMLAAIAGLALAVMGILEAVRSQILGRVGKWLDQRVSPTMIRTSVGIRLSDGKAPENPFADIGRIRSFVSSSGLVAICDSPWVPAFVAIIWLLHPTLGMAALGSACLLFVLAYVSERASRTPTRESNRLTASASAVAESAIRNAEAVRSMGMMGGVLARWKGIADEAYRHQVVATDRGGLITGATKSARATIQIVMMALGAYLVLRGELTPGGMVASSILLGRALAPVEQAIGAWRGFVSARESYAKVSEILSRAEEEKEMMPLPDPKGVLACEQAVFVPRGGDTPIVKGVTFRIMPGHAVGVVGPSASGKSTLCRLLVGALKPTRGNVRLDDADLWDWDEAEVGRHVGYLPQDIELFPGTIAENISRFSIDECHGQIVEAARAAGVHEMILRLPDGYDTDIGKNPHVLSGGQRQRVALARALFGRPKLIVLDEPSSNLDSEGERALMASVAEAKAWGAAVVVVTHGVGILKAVDKIMVLNGGMIEAAGDRDEMMAKLFQRPQASTTTARQTEGAAR